MDTTQFALFFAAILIAYVLVHLRLARFESYLKEIAGLKLLNDRLKSVSDVIERVRLDHVEDLLGQIHDKLEAIESGQRRLERTGGGARGENGAAVALRPAASHAAQIRGVVEQRLLALGYADLRILSDLTGANVDEETSVRVECSRQNMVSKGRVTTRNGTVVDVDLTPVARLFP